MTNPAQSTLADVSRLETLALAGDMEAENELYRVVSHAEDRRVCRAALLALTWITEKERSVMICTANT